MEFVRSVPQDGTGTVHLWIAMCTGVFSYQHRFGKGVASCRSVDGSKMFDLQVSDNFSS